MKKTFKPMLRTEKASQIFRKKTLGVNDALNIKHDSDEMENVQDYWSTAMSVIGNSTIESMDETVGTEQSDTLFNINNIRKSIKENNGEAIYKKSIEENKKESVIINDGTVISNNEAMMSSIIDAESFENRSNIHLSDISNDACLMKADTRVNLVELEKKLISQGKIEAPNLIKFSDLSSLTINKDASVEDNTQQNNHFLESTNDIKINNETDQNQAPSRFKNTNKINNETADNFEMDAQLASFDNMPSHSEVGNTSTSLISNKAKRSKIKNKNKKQPNFEVEAVHDYLDRKNDFVPLICSSEIETGCVNLVHLAFFNSFKSKNACSIYIKMGKIEMTKNGETQLLKRGDIVVVDKDDVYSCSCISKNGACLILTYSL